jgi:hypothetical protein
MSSNVFHDKPYLITKIGFHIQSMKCHVEWESPLEKDPKTKSYAFKRENDEIDPRLGFYTI